MISPESSLPIAIARTLAGKKRRNSPTTEHAQRSHARLFLGLWGERDLKTITAEDIERWIADRRQSVSDGTIKQQLAFLSSVYDQARDLKIPNPVKAVRTRLRDQRRSRWLSAAEEAALEAAFLRVVVEGDLQWTLVRFAILTGCRRLEQLTLRPGDIRPGGVDGEDPQPGELTINRGKCGQRIIPIHPEAVAIAAFWAEVSESEGSPWIFCPEAPTQDIKARCHHGFGIYSNWFTPAAKAAGLANLQWRDLRRTYACRLVEAGVPIFDVQMLLGHSNPKQTMTYTCATMRQLSAAVMKLY